MQQGPYQNTDQTEYTPPVPPATPHPPQRVMINPPAAKPIVTYIILGLTLFVYLAQFLSKMEFNADFVAVLFAKVNPAIISGELWRLVTPALVHGNLIHIGFNMYALWILGRQVEMLFGNGRFFMLYLISAFGGNVLSFAFSEAISVGASTAIFGLIGAQAVFIFKNRHIFGKKARQMLTQIGLILLLNFAISIVPGSSIDLWGHLGGFVAGTAFSVLGAPILKLVRKDDMMVIEDTTHKSDRYVAFLMVLLAFSIIVFFAIRRALP
jgi:rhomboid protease GluP